MTYAPVNGLRLYYEVHGSGRPLVLLHGGLMTIEALAGDVIALPDIAELFALLPDAQLAVLPGTTHVGVTRRPAEVLALVTPFLAAR